MKNAPTGSYSRYNITVTVCVNGEVAEAQGWKRPYSTSLGDLWGI